MLLVMVSSAHIFFVDWFVLLLSRELFDEKWFICCSSTEVQRQRLIRRHLETWTEEKTRMWGEGEEGAARKADANDVQNAQFVNDFSKKYADLVVESV